MATLSTFTHPTQYVAQPCLEHADHRYVKFAHGADVHLHHSLSNVTLHVHSCFFGDDLSESKLHERLGDCTHLTIGQLIDFFETIEFVPASMHENNLPRDVHRRTVDVGSSKLLNALLVAKTLELDELVCDLRLAIAARDFTISHSVEYASILSFFKHRSAYPVDFVRDVLLLLGHLCCPDRINALDDLVELANDACFGPKYYALLVMSIERTKTHGPPSSYPFNASSSGNMAATHVGQKGIVGGVSQSRSTRRWSVNDTNFFDYYCGDGATISTMFEVDSGYITSKPLDDLPFLVDVNLEGVFVVTTKGEDSLAYLFGPLVVGSRIIVQAPISSDAGDKTWLHRLGHIVELSDQSMTVVQDYAPLCETEVNGCVLHILHGPFAGFHYGRPNVDTVPMSCHFFDETSRDEDTFTASADFVIRVPSSRPKRDTAKWRCFLVHSWVMYCRWPYFRRVIDSGMGEFATNVLTLPTGFPPTLLETLIHFLYTGRNSALFSIDASPAQDAFVAEYADMFGFGEDELIEFDPRRVVLLPDPDPLSPHGDISFTNAMLTGVTTVTGGTPSTGATTNSRRGRRSSKRRHSHKRSSAGKSSNRRRSRGR